MKKTQAWLFLAGFAASLPLLSSCSTGSAQDQWKLDDARYKEQLKRYPDRQSAGQRMADAEAARKADNLRK